MAKVCFFARVDDPEVLERVEFYGQDIQLLRDLGHDVRVVTRVRDLRAADLYFIWWWTWAAFPITLARLLRRPRVVTGVFDPWAFPQRPLIERALMRYALRNASANVFVSREEFEELQRDYDAPNSLHIPLSVSDEYHPAPFEYRDEASLFTVIWQNGGNAERKCAFELIRAFAKVRSVNPSATLALAGKAGTATQSLAHLARELEVLDAVEFLGAISKADKIARLQNCALYVQPSRYEGFGMAILEAMACGAPVITSAVGEVPYVVGDAGVFVDGTKPDAIADAALRLLNDENERRSLGGMAAERAASTFGLTRRRESIESVLSTHLA